MATYKSYDELKNKILEQRDIVEFYLFVGEKRIVHALCYQVQLNHLSGLNHRRSGLTYSSWNGEIFDLLNLDPTDFLNVYDFSGNWPIFHTGDYETMTKFVLQIYRLIEGKQIQITYDIF